MQNILKNIAKNPKKYDSILSNTIIKLVPIMNPDGVVIGNSRSSLAGVDLNRRWSNPSATIHPEVYFLKNYILDFYD
jgi:murein tripeptide amidase MpaA